MPTERMQRRIDAFLDQAEAASDGGEWAAVAEKARAVLAIDEGNEDAVAFLKMAEANGAGASSGIAVGEPPVAPAPAAPTLPASFVAGRYAVRRFLGEGGRKRVYLAHDERLARDVAVAVIKTDGLDAQGLSRVRREAQAMAKLGDHPHIVTIHDVGEDKGQPYIVSQYMSGGAVDGLELPLPVVRTLEIAKGVCRGLVHAHAHGIVHRDLKPGNVWLSADGTAEIGDFGLAVAFEQSRLTMQGMLVGTVAYMPPEQALGSEVTPKADLYSLGCMLYEMITGRPPFVSDNPTAVISQHINTPPVAPSWLSDSCPEALEEIVLRLLAKDPAERPANAGEVLAVLDRVDPNEKSASHSDSNILDRLALGVFVGREHELERLRKAFDNAVSGHGGLVMLVGEPGIGKTRTTQELETYAKMRGAQVIWGRTHESAGAPPYFPWLQAGNQYAGAHADDLTALIGPQMPPGTVSELSRVFPWLKQAADFVPPEDVADPQVAQFRLFDAYTSYLKAIANQGPLVVALDDLHWADKPTLQLLQHIARELSRTRILIVANYRDTDITRQSALSETLASLNRESGFDRIVLRGLSRDEVAAYIRARANVEPRPEVLGRIFEETEGNAFFLSEVVNLMAQEGTLSKTSISDIAIPDGVREALGRRLNRLTEETNELLSVAAIIGRDFTYDTLTLLGERDEDSLLKMIEEALEARVIEETEQAGRYRFTHAQMQETLLAELSTTRRVRLHGQVGEALERRYGARADERAARLTVHFSEAATLAPRFSEKAARYATIAGRQALEQAAYPEAARHFRAALSAREGQEVDEQTAELLHDLGRAAIATAQVTEAWRSLRQAFDYYAQKGDVQRAAKVAYLAGTANLLIRPSQIQMVRRAIDLVEEGSEDFGRLNAALGQSAGLLGDEAAAQEAFRRAEAVARRLGVRRLELDVLAAGQFVALFHLHLEESVALGDRAITLAQELNQPDLEAPARFFAAAASFYLGRLDEAAAQAVACMALAERLRHPHGIASAAQALAVVSAGRGDWAATRDAVRRGLEATGDFRALGNGAFVAYQLGETETGKEYQRRLLEAAAMVPPGPSLEYVYLSTLPARAAQISGNAPDIELIRRGARAVLESPVAATPLLKSYVQLALATLAQLTDDRDAAGVLLPQIAALGSMHTDHFCHTDHVRGLLLETLERLDEAVEAEETALDRFAAGYVPARAETAYDCARIRLKRGAPGDRERARVLIDEALGQARKLGMKPLIDRILALKLQDQGIGTTGDIYTSIVAVQQTVASEKPDLTLHAGPDGSITLMFTDIENSTALTVQLGDAKWMDLLREHNAVVESEVRAHSGKVVKNRGDGYMVIFGQPERGLACAAAIQRALAGHDIIRVRIGLHTGNPVQEGKDFFGTDVNLAARVADRALGGQVLVSARLHELFEADGARRFGEPVAMELKGFSGTHAVYAALTP